MPTSSPNQIPIIEMRGITKRFPGVLANDNIDLQIHTSEIHALLGENGAGKSTLMKILYGFYRLDEGSILHEGREVQVRTPHDAIHLNIGMVFQVLNLIPAMSVYENIALFLKDLPAAYAPARIKKRIQIFSDQYGLEVNPDDLVAQLSIGEQQKVEILKLLLSDSRILILDEPTRVLAPHEIIEFFKILKRLKQDGYAIVLITHKLKEVFDCADRITVLRGGKVAGSLKQPGATEEALIQLMFEKTLTTRIVREEVPQPALPVLQLCQMSTRAEGAAVSLNAIDLSVFGGEIVGIAGVSGNGQRELCDTILGTEKITSGQKLVKGEDLTRASNGKLRKLGFGFIPENPLSMATVPFMSVLENMAITRTSHYANHGGFGMDWQLVKQDTSKSLEKFGFTFSYYVPVKSLSGGNLQRLIIAREIQKDPQLIVASYLTRGLDVQSALIARKELMDARNNGAGVLLISEDLDELFSLSDRIIVLFEGRIVGEFQPSETDVYQVGYLMTGTKESHES